MANSSFRNFFLQLILFFNLLTPAVFAGPVFDDMSSDTYQTTFSKEICELNWKKAKLWKKKERETCNSKWYETFISRLGLEYPKADAGAVLEVCKSHPVECKNPENVESWFQISNEQRLKADARRRAAIANAENQRMKMIEEEQEKENERRMWNHLIQAGQQIGCAFGRTCEKQSDQ